MLSEQAIVNYKVDNYYSKEHDSGILFNDSDLNINWELDESEIEYSKKDLNLPQLKNLNIL